MATSAKDVVEQLLTAETREAALALIHVDVVVEDWMDSRDQIVGNENVYDTIFLPASEAFDEYRYDIQDMICDGNKVAVRARFSGRFVKPYLGFAATNKMVGWRFNDIYEVRDGRISKMWFGSDTATELKQLAS